MVKPRGKVTRNTTPKPAYAVIGEPEVESGLDIQAGRPTAL